MSNTNNDLPNIKIDFENRKTSLDDIVMQNHQMTKDEAKFLFKYSNIYGILKTQKPHSYNPITLGLYAYMFYLRAIALAQKHPAAQQIDAFFRKADERLFGYVSSIKEEK